MLRGWHFFPATMAPGKELDTGPILEADSDENTGIFFKYIGAFKAPPGACSTATALQVAPDHGVLVFRTAAGVGMQGRWFSVSIA